MSLVSGTSTYAAMQVRLRPREHGLLLLMAERERRRPQDQAAVLISRALEEWFENNVPEFTGNAPELQPQEGEPGWIEEE